MMDAMAHRTLRPTDTATGALALDVSEADNVYTVTTALPGVKADDIQIHLKDGVLTISAEIPQRVNERKDGERVLLRERVWGKFSRSVRLPDTVNGDAVEAVYEDGVLTLTLPKAEAALPRTIAVKALKG
jgi:HSP20 family protein